MSEFLGDVSMTRWRLITLLQCSATEWSISNANSMCENPNLRVKYWLDYHGTAKFSRKYALCVKMPLTLPRETLGGLIAQFRQSQPSRSSAQHAKSKTLSHRNATSLSQTHRQSWVLALFSISVSSCIINVHNHNRVAVHMTVIWSDYLCVHFRNKYTDRLAYSTVA